MPDLIYVSSEQGPLKVMMTDSKIDHSLVTSLDKPNQTRSIGYHEHAWLTHLHQAEEYEVYSGVEASAPPGELAAEICCERGVLHAQLVEHAARVHHTELGTPATAQVWPAGATRHITSAKRKTVDPVWNEHFSVEVSTSDTLVLEVWDEDNSSDGI